MMQSSDFNDESRSSHFKRLLHSVAFLFLFFAFCSNSCQHNPFAHRFLRREPSVGEVVGSYELKEVYVDMIESGLNEKISAKKPRSMIELRADGSAVLRSFPIIQAKDDGFEYAFQAFEDIETRWCIDPAGCVSSGGDESTTVYGITFSHEPMKAQRWATFTGEREVTGMIFTFYDGDQGQILGFTKQQKNSSR